MALNKLIIAVLLICSTSLFTLQAAEQNDSIAPSVNLNTLSKRIGLPLSDSEYTPHVSLYQEAAKWLGVRYRRAGMSAKGMDCSGLTSVIYQNVFNHKLVRSSNDMSRAINQEISKSDLKPGDLVFFATRGRQRINHVGVFLGDKLFIHASCGKGVIISSLDEPYYLKSWRKGGRM